ncbi:MAG: hypothetical protein HG428_005610 [Bacteroidia bacterium]|nr:hypothetical protein [Bacteroidia bacterium]
MDKSREVSREELSLEALKQIAAGSEDGYQCESVFGLIICCNEVGVDHDKVKGGRDKSAAQ